MLLGVLLLGLCGFAFLLESAAKTCGALLALKMEGMCKNLKALPWLSSTAVGICSPRLKLRPERTQFEVSYCTFLEFLCCCQAHLAECEHPF